MLERHDLLNEFAEHSERLRALADGDQAFAQLFAEYGGLDEEIFQLEAAGTPVSDSHIETLKKRRAQLKDRVFAALV